MNISYEVKLKRAQVWTFFLQVSFEIKPDRQLHALPEKIKSMAGAQWIRRWKMVPGAAEIT